LGPMTARISPRLTSKSTRLSAVRPPKRTVSASVRRTEGPEAPPLATLAEEGGWREGSAVT
jgi:hypothetical protein